MKIEIRMVDDFGEEIIDRRQREVLRVPSVGELIMLLTDGKKYCGTVTRILNSYVDKEYSHSLEFLEQYTVYCLLTRIIDIDEGRGN